MFNKRVIFRGMMKELNSISDLNKVLTSDLEGRESSLSSKRSSSKWLKHSESQLSSFRFL